MTTFASALIDKLGGTASVASLADTAMSTVVRMRRRCTDSRLNHLRRIAVMEGLSDEVAALAATYGVELPELRRRNAIDEVSHASVGAA